MTKKKDHKEQLEHFVLLVDGSIGSVTALEQALDEGYDIYWNDTLCNQGILYILKRGNK